MRIAVQGLAYIPEEQTELRDMLCRWTPAFSKTLMCHLRNENEPAKELQVAWLPPLLQVPSCSQQGVEHDRFLNGFRGRLHSAGAQA